VFERFARQVNHPSTRINDDEPASTNSAAVVAIQPQTASTTAAIAPTRAVTASSSTSVTAAAVAAAPAEDDMSLPTLLRRVGVLKDVDPLTSSQIALQIEHEAREARENAAAARSQQLERARLETLALRERFSATALATSSSSSKRLPRSLEEVGVYQAPQMTAEEERSFRAKVLGGYQPTGRTVMVPGGSAGTNGAASVLPARLMFINQVRFGTDDGYDD
jgi:hypothetical protein